MKKLAPSNPDLVRLITLPLPDLEGRRSRASRSPRTSRRATASRCSCSWASTTRASGPRASTRWSGPTSSCNGYNGGDARCDAGAARTRTIVVPIVNPDGFNASREAGELDLGGGADADPPATPTSDLADRRLDRTSTGARTAACADGDAPGRELHPARAAASAASPAWTRTATTAASGAGPGASTDPLRQTTAAPARSPSPRRRTSASSSRAPGDHPDHQPHVLGPRAAPARRRARRARRPTSDLQGARRRDGRRERLHEPEGYELYDTTGTTEDWSYYVHRRLGFTFEIGAGLPPALRRDVAE